MIIKSYHKSVAGNHNANQPYYPDRRYWILIICGSGSKKTNVLLNLIEHEQPDLDT